MKNIVRLLCVVSSLQCVTSQISLVESGPGTVKPTEDISLTCKVTGASLTDSTNMFGVSWIRQSAGKGLEWLGDIYYDASKTIAQSLQGRLELSRDTNKGEVYFKLAGAKIEQAGRYHCARHYSNYFDYWGQGTMVTVTSAEKSAPSVFPLRPCCGTLDSQNEVTIGCLATGYLPTPVDVKWNSGSITTGIKNFPYVQQSSGYTSTSILTIPYSDWESKSFSCNVEHKPTDSTITKIVPECKVLASAPTVEVMQGSCGDIREGGTVELVCLISGYAPENINVQWLKDGVVTSIPFSSITQYKTDNGTYISRNSIQVLRSDFDGGDTFTCRAIHMASKTKPEDSIKKCSGEERCSIPKMTLLPPSPKELLIDTDDVKVTCVVSNMESDDTLKITWSRSDSKGTIEPTSISSKKIDGTYTTKATLKISSQDWQSDKKFTCKAGHDDLIHPISKTIYKSEERVLDPSVFVYPPPQDEIPNNEYVSLLCMVYGFKPQNIYIQWKKSGMPQDEELVINTSPVEQNGTYFMVSKLKIRKSDWFRGATFTCGALHNKVTPRDISIGQKDNKRLFRGK